MGDGLTNSQKKKVIVRGGAHYGIKIGDDEYIRFGPNSWWHFDAEAFHLCRDTEALEALFVAIYMGETPQ